MHTDLQRDWGKNLKSVKQRLEVFEGEQWEWNLENEKKHREHLVIEVKVAGMQERNCTNIVTQSSGLWVIFIYIAVSNVITHFQWPLNALTESDFSLQDHLCKLKLPVNWVLICSPSKNIQNPGKRKRGTRKECFLAPRFDLHSLSQVYTAYLRRSKTEQTVLCWFWEFLHFILHPPYGQKLSIFLIGFKLLFFQVSILFIKQ